MAQKYIVRLGDEIKEIEVEDGPSGSKVRIDGEWHDVRMEQIGNSSLFTLVIDNEPTEIFAEERATGYDLVIGFDRYVVDVHPADAGTLARLNQELRAAASGGEWAVLSPMSGVVVDIFVQPDQQVNEGDMLIIIEAMKMNNELRAQRTGVVSAVHVEKGQRVEPGVALLTLAQP